MSYKMKISPKSRKSARIISMFQKIIQDEYSKSGLTQQEIADKLDVDKSVINRRLKGSANLTVRSIAELSFVFNKEIVFFFKEKEHNENIVNHCLNIWSTVPEISEIKEPTSASPITTKIQNFDIART